MRQAICELRNPAVCRRHWVQLIEATQRKYSNSNRSSLEVNVDFVDDTSTTLDDLLSLEMHKHADEVGSVVERAVKEVQMEKTLKELQSTWAVLELDRELHARTGLYLLKASEDLIAIIEDNQVIDYAHS